MNDSRPSDINVNIRQDGSSGLATASLVLGIIGLVLAFIPVIGLLAWILSPLAITFSVIALRNTTSGQAKRSSAKAGLVTGIVALLVCFAWAGLFIIGGSSDSTDDNADIAAQAAMDAAKAAAEDAATDLESELD